MAEPGKETLQEQVNVDLQRARKFLDYLQESSARGDRADDAQLASLGMARTPCRTWYREGSCRIFEYEVLGDHPHPIPILMVYSFINRWYILDLMPGHSFIEALSKAGFQVYMIDWGIPGPEHANLGLEYYLETVTARAMRRIRAKHGGRPLTLFGYCLGGTLAGIQATLHPEDLAALVLLTTPLTFDSAGILSIWTNKDFFDSKKITQTFGVIPEKFLHASFPFMTPKASLAKNRLLFDNILNDAYLKNIRSLDRWATDNVPFPGRVFGEIIADCYQENLLAKGTMRVGGRPVDLGAVTCPTLNIFAKNDHIVPPATAARNADLLCHSQVTNREYDAAHLTVTVAHPIRETVWKETIEWLSAQETRKGNH